MRDLEERLSVLNTASPPDVWQDAVNRLERGTIDPRALLHVRQAPRRPAMLAFAAALVIVVGAVALSAGSSDETYTVMIPSVAIEPTLQQGQCATIDTDAYAGTTPSRGDVIAFRDAASGIMMVKRVIGLPGKRVEQVDGVVTVDGGRLDEPYVIPDLRGTMDGAWMVENDHLFVMGDNRPMSNDSRFTLGQVPFGAVEGQVLIGVGSSECDVPAPPAPTSEG